MRTDRAGAGPVTPVAAPPAGLMVRGAVVRYDDGEGARGGVTTAVDRVDLDVADGEILALLGPSGCGKSSLLRAVAGLEPLAAGSVTYDGADLAGVPVHRRGFGLLFQDGQLFAHRDVGRNVAYGLEVAGASRAERSARVRELLAAVGLAGYERRAVTTLSGGEKQRVALARALAPRPRLLLLDEPFSALDRALRERLADDVRDVLHATGTTAVFVTHDHDEAFTVADRVGIMQAGRLLQVAAPEELWRTPASREVAEFLGYQAFVPQDGGWLAVGPTGLRVVEPGTTGADGGTAARVVGSAFRRGRTEVTVDVDLGAGTQRLVALADGAPALEPGTAVVVETDPAGTAAVPR
ncbi:ABC transporter related protein [Xylanimonas cellulosilytica DSM 15894]|uniref:ABC-type quaternary amine transporter n=1 Tax=Xylanimonas cellulosilytica (strain DSM 15894 / JCM 12276 / CECT 5975 / KCTC 9989 / LMG 20990 / NBRC 107835 / XIL07) TaxID=446471 RepID=D1BU55_XYLCX|nr:ATP-binding cassette domain-containing protein [Xylanimonas cellulosilytica]ACZ29219.1 ABC transporter related protein [Xylanimonas cellulosilytica DSM 15894]